MFQREWNNTSTWTTSCRSDTPTGVRGSRWTTLVCSCAGSAPQWSGIRAAATTFTSTSARNHARNQVRKVYNLLKGVVSNPHLYSFVWLCMDFELVCVMWLGVVNFSNKSRSAISFHFLSVVFNKLFNVSWFCSVCSNW